jgi:hypothetical protein
MPDERTRDHVPKEATQTVKDRIRQASRAVLPEASSVVILESVKRRMRNV